MRKDVTITLFYGMYFTWLFIYTTLSPKEVYLNYFTLAIVVFYFIFLREKWDLVWFVATIALTLYLRPELYAQVQSTPNYEALLYSPLWLPLGWATTVVALRKLFSAISSNK
jgi:hypothetical protein